MLMSDIDPAQEELLVPSGLVHGYTPHWRRPLAVSPSPLSTGLTDRLNDTVEVAACLQLIFECDWSSQWVAFHQFWADKRDLFSAFFVRVCLHIYACCSEEMHKRKISLWLLSGLCRNLRDDEFCKDESPVCNLLIYCVLIWKHCAVQTEQWTLRN